MDADKYQKMLVDQNIINEIKNVKGKVIFMQDNAKAHVAKTTKGFFKEHEINLFPNWPPSSCDLNPIEHCWSILKRKIRWTEDMTEDEMFYEAEKAWRTISKQKINKL